jgi:structure-specific recognition protein 1
MITLLKLCISKRSSVFLLQEWEGKATKLKEEYAKAVKEYVASGGGRGVDSKEKKKDTKKKESTPKSSPAKSGNFKSKEYISDVDSSSSSEKDDEDKKEKKVSKKPPAAKKPVSLL